MSKKGKLGMSKKDKITELQYTIEALEDEIENWQEESSEARAKLWEVIQENDRLTITYEPYRPPGDEHENLDFYGLIEENDELKGRISSYATENNRLQGLIWEYKTEIAHYKQEDRLKEAKKPFIKNDRWWNFSIELWPGAWGLNYYRYKWRKYSGTSREGSIQLGPIGFSWNREPKK